MKPVCQLTRNSMIWLIVSILLVVAPFFGMIPMWLYGVAMLTIGWRLLVHTGRLSFPHWSVRLLLVFAVMLGLMFQAQQGTTIQLTVALLIAAFLLKLTELYQRRDALVVIFVSFLLCSCIFMFHQTIVAALYVFLVLIVITAALNTVYRSEQNKAFWRPLKRAAVLYSQSLPMMLVLFLIFPRLPPLWQVDMDSGQSFTGLSDSMAPGEVSNLTRSAEIAFRVSFSGQVPPENERYWRGIVYDYFDGQRWSISDTNLQSRLINGGVNAGTEYRYQLVMEPTGQQWRYALDYPTVFQDNLQLAADMTLSAKSPLLSRRQFEYVSRNGRLLDSLNAEQFEAYTQLPASGNPKASALAQQWSAEAETLDGFVEKLLQYYQTQFTYTLQPPRLFNNQIDSFLFDTQRGFCGHFAGSAVYLFRAAGIPARVVGGYQGGEINPEDGTLIVRQYAAHAWLEYWDGEHWLRLDPTAVVSPDRLEQPLDELFRDQPGFLADSLLYRSGIFSADWMKSLQQQYDALNFSWHRWVLNFHDRQTGILQSLLGDLNWQRILLVLFVPTGLVFAGVALQLLYRRKPQSDPITAGLEKLDRKLASREQQRRTGETVMQHMARLAGYHPALAEQLMLLGHYHQDILYREDLSDRLQQQFHQQLQRCYDQLP